ncbi:hybrid sensor histidine kinase/response regulator transcription factor [Urechidicola croceus]|uniref:histidine kinase n=1 Tax=Urechidicola croceus TaxID=1850246 RepID=A0A1D8P6F4_9FLAO|nr:hybrid sensor histidine kinase/response regulator transcription factor [Urechidicola croceus]AOW20142.1 hybrid sensor histidine kinase/response regulator [Urechidicola croceus]
MINKKVFFPIFFLFFLFTSTTFSQESLKEYNFVNIKEGISNVAVATIIQDHYGFIWLGTNGSGLYKFDGIDYTFYKYEISDSTSISSSLIYSTYLDKKNRLWVGTEEGLNLYDRDLDQFIRIPFPNDDSSTVSVRSITSDSSGDLFVGTHEKGLFKIDSGKLEMEQIPVFYGNRKKTIINVNSIKTSKNDKVYVGTEQGLKEYDKKENLLKTTYINTEEGVQSIDEAILTLLVDELNTLWIGTISDGVIKLDVNENSLNKIKKINHFKFTKRRILSMMEISENSLMIGTENDGLINIDRNGNILKTYLTDKQNKNSIKSNSIWSLFSDNNDRIWMGYYNSGVGVYDKLYDKFQNLESLTSNTNSLEIASVTGIDIDHLGRLWIGMDGGGIDIYNPNTKKFLHINEQATKTYQGLTNYDIQTVFIDSKKNVWAGSWSNGLFLLEHGTKKFVNYNIENSSGIFESNIIQSFDEDSNGIIWIGTFDHGIMSYDPNTKKFKNYNIKPFIDKELNVASVRKVLVDSQDNIWIGTALGLYRIKKLQNNNFVIESMSDPMTKTIQNKTSSNHILSLYESSDESLWIGTRGSGLCKFDKIKDEFIWYIPTYGLEEVSVSSIIESLDGNIWISGNSGISRIDVETNKIINYTTNDGLLSNDFNYNAALRDGKGNIYFGNYKGVDFFHPKRILLNKNLPTMHLTDFRLFNKKVMPNQPDSPLKKVISETDSISLSHKQSVFTIEYSGLNYTRPEKNQYAYYLEGLEKSWNYVGNSRSATYTNLDQGNYTFKLKVANNDGVWNEKPLELKIRVLPPWWRTDWAFLSYLVLFFLGLYLLNKINQSRIAEKELISYERKKRIQEDKLSEKKLQFFTNISHEFRTPLSLITNPLEDILSDEELKLPQRIKQKHVIIQKNARRLSRLISELMDFRKLELNKLNVRIQKINLGDITKEVAEYFEEEARNKNINLNINIDSNEYLVWADERMLEKIIFNILSNAFKVTQENGTITINVSIKKKLVILPLVNKHLPTKVFEISIIDTGPGLEKEQVKKIFERFYQIENMNKTYYGGTGIGLEVVDSFVKLHKGKIKVSSKVGQGTNFRIFLPLGKDHFNEQDILSIDQTQVLNKGKNITSEPYSIQDDNQESDEKSIKLPTLLLVEDNSELRSYLKNELKSNYRILTAVNGKEGLKQAKAHSPDIIITDVIMPEMDGFEFCKKIKESIETSHIPLLMLTAKTRIDDRIEGIGLGADAYMIKPFDMRLLKLRLSQLITSRKLIFDKYFGAISGAEENSNATSLDKDFIQKILTYVNDNIGDTDLSVELLASEFHLSRSQLYRKVKALTGQTVNEFIRKVRLQKAKQVLEGGNKNISEVCYKVGFSSPSYFTKCFKEHFGLLPTEIVVKSI